MQFKRFSSVYMLVISCFMVTSCASVRFQVPVQRPAEINLKGKKELLLLDDDGTNVEANRNIQNSIKEQISNTQKFTLIERKHLDQILGEVKLSLAALTTETAKNSLGKLASASVLLIPHIEKYQYEEKLYKTIELTCTEKSTGRTVDCSPMARTGSANIDVSFDVVDLETGSILKTKRAKCSESVTNNALPNTPVPEIDGSQLLSKCTTQVAIDLLKAIAPYEENVEVELRDDSNLPTIAVGISYAKQGLWQDTLTQFDAAVQEAEANTGIPPDTKAKAYWNLSIAYQYNGRFDEAIAMVQKSFNISKNGEDLKYIKIIEAEKKKYENLQAQQN